MGLSGGSDGFICYNNIPAHTNKIIREERNNLDRGPCMRFFTSVASDNSFEYRVNG